jgi:hypothetical protein
MTKEMESTQWFDAYPQAIQPTPKDISKFIANPLWERLNKFIQENYDIEPQYAYSGCAAQTGWNIKYKKSSKALCTLYPMDGYFISLIVVGEKELDEVNMIMPTCTEHVRHLFETSKFMPRMGMWLMIEVTDEDILEDVENLIQIKKRIPTESGSAK